MFKARPGSGLYRNKTDESEKLPVVSKAHKRSVAIPLSDYRANYSNRDGAMAKAYLSGASSMTDIARYFK